MVHTVDSAGGRCEQDTVQRVWRDNVLKPHRIKNFKVSNDPQFLPPEPDSAGCAYLVDVMR